MTQIDLFTTDGRDLTTVDQREPTEAEVTRWLRARGYTVKRARTTPHNGTETSAAAARSMRPVAGTLRARVLAVFERCGAHGATCDEVERDMDGRHQTISARVYELRNGGWIVDSGRTRKTRSGRQAIVYVLTEDP